MSTHSSSEAAAVYLASGAFLMAGAFRMIFVGADTSSLVAGGALMFGAASLIYLGLRRLVGKASQPEFVRPAKSSTALRRDATRERRKRHDRREEFQRRQIDLPVAYERRLTSADRRRRSDRRFLRPVPRIVSWE